MRIVVVGASLAGWRTVEALRANGSDAEIVLVGAEVHAPYDRPPLSKGVLLGTTGPEELALAAGGGSAGPGVDLRVGVTAVGLDPARPVVALDDGTTLEGDAVVVATGARPRRPLWADPSQDNVFTLRTLDDAVALRAAMTRSSSMVVVGSGFIGSEVASAGRELGLAVTVVEAAPAPLARVFGEDLGRRFGAFHAAAGSTLVLGRTVAAVEGDGRAERVVLDDARVLSADVVVVGVGCEPVTGWLAGSGLDVTDGVRCDEHGRALTADGLRENVFAVGDVTRWWSPRYGDAVRTEHWTAAGDQAAVVAGVLTGTPAPTDLVPYVWSDQFGHRIQLVGRPGRDDEVLVLEDDAQGLAALTGRDGRVASAVVVDRPRLFGRLRRLVVAGAGWDAARAEAAVLHP